MRLRTLLTTTALLLAAFTLAPITQAHETPRCDETHVFDGLNSITLREDCTLEIGILDGATCVGAWGERIEGDAAGHTARVLVCNGGILQQLPPIDVATTERPCPTGFNTPWPASQVLDIYLDQPTCQVTLTVLAGYWCAVDPTHIYQHIEKVTVQTPVCPVLWAEASESHSGLFRDPNQDEAGICTDHLGGGILNPPDACVIRWSCLGAEPATKKDIGTPIGTLETQRCIPGSATGPVI